MRVKRQLETPLPARPEDAGFGATRSLIGKRHWKSEDSGQPGASVSMLLKDARFEATRMSIAGTAGRCRERGNPEPHRKVLLEEQAQGQPGASPPVTPKDARFEATRRSIAGKVRRGRFRGDSGLDRRAERGRCMV